MSEKISDQKLAEMLKHLDAVVGGPWVSIHHSGPGSEVRQADSDPTNKHHWPFRIAQTISGQIAQADRANFDHIARCDPDTMRSILTELIALRTQPNTVIEAGEWQDISTAPKNRTPIMLLSPEGDVGIGYLENTGYDDLKFVSGSAAWCGTRPYDRAAAVWLGGIRAEDATHWRPLPLPPLSPSATHRHKKRGTEYVLIGSGKMQAEHWWTREVDHHGRASPAPVDMREVAIYRSATDPTEIWVRPREEFEDGRFEALSPSATGGK